MHTLEKRITLEAAARHLLETRGLKRTPKTLWQWLYYGRFRGEVKLEVESVAGIWHTSAEALDRFLSACTRRHSSQSALNVAELKT